MIPMPTSRIQLAFATLALLLSACSGAAGAPSEAEPPEGDLGPVIIDADMAQEDMHAILYLLQHPDAEVKAITVVGTGEVHCEPGVRHALGLLALHGTQDVPVACGREEPLAGDHTFPTPWRQDVDNLYGLSLPEGGQAPTISAPELIRAVVSGSPDPVTIVAVGPLTNVAQALELAPGIADNIRMIYVMGGAIEVAGNVGVSGVGIDNRRAEWNIYIDPNAANTVFGAGVPVTLVPLDATQDAPVTERFHRMLGGQRKTSEAEFVYQLLTASLDLIQFGGFHFWDSLTAAIATDESLATFTSYTIEVVEAEGPESGYTEPNPAGEEVRVAVSAEGGRFEQTFLDTLNLP